jgi:hypothetical protein
MLFCNKQVNHVLISIFALMLWHAITMTKGELPLHVFKDDNACYLCIGGSTTTSGKELYRCPVGSISVSPDGVCIHDLIADELSVTDAILQTLITGSLSANDVVVASDFTLSTLSSDGIIHNDSLGLFTSSLIVNADVSASAAITDTKLATISTAGKVANSATTATTANTASAIVARDSSGNFVANMMTLNGTPTNATDAATKDYVDSAVSLVSGTSTNTPNALVLRNGSGNFSAGSVSITDATASGNLILAANPSTSTTGNILKGSNRFIHNFGTNNTFVGESAGNFTMSGSGQNSVFGKNGLTANTTGNNNTALGFNTLGGCTTGSSNVAIGSDAGGTLTTGSNNIYISASAGTAAESNTIRIGAQGTQTSCFIGGVRGVPLTLSGLAVVVDSSGQLGTVLSTQKIKTNIRKMKEVSSKILKLRPVVFNYKGDVTGIEQYGLIAEEVAQIFPTIVVMDENEEPLSVQYHVLPVLLLNEMQKQQVTIGEMQDLIAYLYSKLENFAERLRTIEDSMGNTIR